MSTSQFQTTRGCAALLLPNDYGGEYAQEIRQVLLKELHDDQQINAVVFDCTNLQLIDRRDLHHLLETIRCIRLMGKGVGFCSISASLAAVMVSLAGELKDCHFGLSLDDTINRLVG